MELCEGLDLLDELRLRRWARENYREPKHRSASWHPVIVDEMLRRDAEGRLQGSSAPAPPSSPPQRRYDAKFGPRGIAPHFGGGTGQIETAEAGEMHYF